MPICHRLYSDRRPPVPLKRKQLRGVSTSGVGAHIIAHNAGPSPSALCSCPTWKQPCETDRWWCTQSHNRSARRTRAPPWRGNRYALFGTVGAVVLATVSACGCLVARHGGGGTAVRTSCEGFACALVDCASKTRSNVNTLRLHSRRLRGRLMASSDDLRGNNPKCS